MARQLAYKPAANGCAHKNAMVHALKLHASGGPLVERKQAEDHLERLQHILSAHLPSAHVQHEPTGGMLLLLTSARQSHDAEANFLASHETERIASTGSMPTLWVAVSFDSKECNVC